ncbi:MAG TPA: DUF1553 domain-containing protein [Pirellulaceae bacterium]|nr:DUF1553 domain-containing protein [Pirellulaceae bacterium]
MLLFRLALCLGLSLLALSVRAAEPKHWAYQPVVRPPLPAVQPSDWPRNAIDRFTLAKMEQHALSPAAPAARHELLRRVTFDLTGLPPTAAEVAAFENDKSPDAYERAVDRLFAAPSYGERMATHWLDLARYADTHGYHFDSHRDMWRYRNEVIAAFQRHQPYDQFTIEQLAGDLLPNATLTQKIASGFNRNHMVNFESGTIPEEYRNEYVTDRVATTSAVWLGQTLECAKCHDHKYDPFSMRDFYSLYAFFNNVPELGLDGRRGNAAPTIIAPTRAQQAQLAAYDARIEQLTAALAEWAAAAKSAQANWEAGLRSGEARHLEPPRDWAVYFPLDETAGDTVQDAVSDDRIKRPPTKINGDPNWLPGKFGGALAFDGATSFVAADKLTSDARAPFTLAAWVFPTTPDAMTIAAVLESAPESRGWELSLDAGQLNFTWTRKSPDDVLHVRGKQALANSRWQQLIVSYDGSGTAAGVKCYLGVEPLALETVRDQLGSAPLTVPQSLVIGRGGQEQGFRGLLDDVRVFTRELTTQEVARMAESDPVRALLTLPAENRTAEQTEQIHTYYLEQHDPRYLALMRDKTLAIKRRRDYLAACPTTMVMSDSQPRETFVLEHGSYDQRGEQVTANTPEVLPPLPADAPRNRLTLARWLVDGQHPLTARVAVNRFWQLHFAQGIVRTPQDFGTQGDKPTHPELLDWLAAEFVASGWDVQHMQRLIVTSATYRQSSHATPQSSAHDAGNLYLSHFPRTRLPAEMLRDQALAVSGLLLHQECGPGVFPYQPPGLWEELGNNDEEYTAQRYAQSHGADLYRRSVYSFFKRTSPQPNMTNFDATGRETCTVTRSPTNTPLQALVLWNDPTYIEAARVLAERALRANLPSERARISFIFREVLGREPATREQAALARLFSRQQSVYRADVTAARALVSVGERPRAATLDTAELAAWTIVAQAVLNTDEALSRN